MVGPATRRRCYASCRVLKIKQENEVTPYEASSLKPMTVEELVARSRASDEDIKSGRTYDIDF